MADLGAGVIILIVIWVITLALLTLFTFVQSPLRFIGFIALIIAIIITLVLTLLPRGNNQTSVVNNTPYNYVGLARILILTFLCLTFFFGLILIFFYEILPPIYAQPIRKRFIFIVKMSGGRDESITVFLGDLSRDATKEEVEKTFSYYGKLRSVWLSRSPWGYGFIDFEDQRDAADAVKALDGKMICGSRVRVEFSHGRGRSNRNDRVRRRSGSRSPRSRKPFNPHDVCYECGDRGHYAYDCEIRLRRQRRIRSNSRSRSRSTRRMGNGHSSRRDERSHSGSSRSSNDRRRSHSRSRSGSVRSKDRRSR